MTATATDYGAGIGGGGYNGNGGIIKLLGGIVNATGGSGIYSGAGVGGGGSPQGTGNGGEITIDGDVVLFAAGGTGVNPAEAIGSGGNSSQDGTIVKNTGMVFEDKTGMVHGCPNLPGEVKIPSGSTLTVPDGSTLTVLDGSTLINNGTLENFGTVNGAGNIQNNGTINDNSNGISVNINGSRANKPSAVDIIFQNSQNGLITKAIYGDTIRITATARKAADTRLRSAAVNQVTFYIESIAPEHKLGETTVITSGETATATLEITLSGNEWNKGFVFGVNTILADFGGAAALNLLADTGSKNLTMEKAAQTTPAAPTLSSRTDTSITLNSVSGQKYTFTTSDTPPAITIAGWKTASGPTLTFDGLTDGTSYWFWTYIPEDSTHKSSSLSNSLPSTTYVSTAEVTITEPAVGIVPDTTAAVHGNTGYTVEKTTWTEGTTPQTGSFAYNTAYSVSIELKAKADFQFAGNVNGSINGNTAMVHVLNNSSVILSYTFPKIGTQSGGSSSSSGGNHDSSGSDSSSASMIIPKDSYLITGDRINKPIPRSDLQWLVDSAKSLTFSCDKASMTFDPAALRAILAAVPSTAGTITFTAAPADLSAFLYASAQIGSHPVYDFTIPYKDSKGNTVTVNVAFPAGSASVTLTCPLSAAETEGSLFMVCVDDKGNVTWLDKSSYDSGRMLADAPHFSVYGTAYKAPAVVFTDTEDHWAKNDIEFAAARGLLSATGNGLFSPDAAMTRGMFVTALGRLAGINPVSYTIRSFTDVKADDYYAPYVEWAAQQNIVKGTGEGLFSPDVPVTREQMAVILTKYAGQMGYSLPATLTEAAFSDNDAISAWAAKEVTAMQRAGIVKDKDGNRFDPQGNTTRAEISVVLHRFVEIVIDPATANGWGKNDSGQWFYYRNGKALTGWQTIGKQNYYFNTNGVRE